ncbi:MAG: glycosyltransferase [Chloroflexi bacterium]|nr:glycosyltransferase [Chloroflexota bacterium]
MTITVVTPWRNAHELTDGYLAALVAAPLRNGDKVYVIDNASEPPLPLPGCRLAVNAGYAGASNVGLAAARTDAVLFLNNDVVHTRIGWLDAIRGQLRPGVLVGAELDPGRHAAVDGRAYAYLSGWCLAGMTSDLRALHGFDTIYEEPAYYSDNDLCVRARAAGMKLIEAEVGLRHLGNYTTRRRDVTAVTAANFARFQRLVRAHREAAVC